MEILGVSKMWPLNSPVEILGVSKKWVLTYQGTGGNSESVKEVGTYQGTCGNSGP